MRLLLSTLLVLLPFLMTAQPLEGLIEYDQVVNMHKRMKGDKEEFKKYIPEFQTTKMQLLLKGRQTIFKNAPEEDGTFEKSEGNFKFSMKKSETVIYKNLKADEQLTATEFLGRKFLIEEEPERRFWKISGESKSILGYSCTKAVFQDTSDKLEAWFTLSLPGSAGPASYDGLPGVILEVNKNEGEVVFTATHIELKPLAADDFEVPTKGKKVTRQEYDAIVKEKMEEMGGTSSGGSRVMIIKQ